MISVLCVVGFTPVFVFARFATLLGFFSAAEENESAISDRILHWTPYAVALACRRVQFLLIVRGVSRVAI